MDFNSQNQQIDVKFYIGGLVCEQIIVSRLILNRFTIVRNLILLLYQLQQL